MRSRDEDLGLTPASSVFLVRDLGGGATCCGGGGATGAGGGAGIGGGAAPLLPLLSSPNPGRHIVIHPFYLRSTPPRNVVRLDT